MHECNIATSAPGDAAPAQVMHAPGAKSANRVNVILNDDTFSRTRSLTPGVTTTLMQPPSVCCSHALYLQGGPVSLGSSLCGNI